MVFFATRTVYLQLQVDVQFSCVITCNFMYLKIYILNLESYQVKYPVLKLAEPVNLSVNVIYKFEVGGQRWELNLFSLRL